MSALLEIGYVARAHGIRGEIRVVPHDGESKVLSEAAHVTIGGERFGVGRARRVQGGYLLTLEGVTDRNRAETLRGNVVEVARSLIPLGDGEILLADLIGCQVALADGAAYGEVVGIAAAGQDLLVIHHGEFERLLPYVPEFIKSVDLDARRLVVEPPPGLPESEI